jgi:hypothetical protein
MLCEVHGRPQHHGHHHLSVGEHLDPFPGRLGANASVSSGRGQGVSANRLRPMLSIQTSLLTTMPADVGQMLPGS